MKKITISSILICICMAMSVETVTGKRTRLPTSETPSKRRKVVKKKETADQKHIKELEQQLAHARQTIEVLKEYSSTFSNNLFAVIFSQNSVNDSLKILHEALPKSGKLLIDWKATCDALQKCKNQ
ncbi:MAG TPA: hypothetical protein VEK38_01340 [Candidatus Bathyarchaeia archaeon]|nr:hypothetical protein [Candidatus Bathyarchaeia archaeon]